MRKIWLTMAAAGAVLAAALGASGSQAQPGTATPDEAGRLVPDIVTVLPKTVHIGSRTSPRRGTRRLLEFSGAVTNNGAGPLIVRTERGNLGGTGRLSARQAVVRTDGRRTVTSGPLLLRYVTAGGHSHFHLQDFMRYELRTVDGRRVRADRKQGFCLGDRYDATGGDRFPAEPASAVFRGRCGLSNPRLRNLTMGISVGFGDDYRRGLEGQFIDITGLPSGRYVLVFRYDPRGLLLDQHEDNDVASLLLRVDAGSARTQARILSWCTNTDACTVPGRHRSQVPAGRIR
jgi:Lysyl oxidase